MNIIVKLVAQNDFRQVNQFYLKALYEEHQSLISSEDMKKLLNKYQDDRWITSWFKGYSTVFMVHDENNTVIGILTTEYFLNNNSVTINITTLNNDNKKLIINTCIEKILHEYKTINEITTEVYEKNMHELDLFKSLGFEITDTSTAPAGDTTLKVHWTQKVYNKNLINI